MQPLFCHSTVVNVPSGFPCRYTPAPIGGRARGRGIAGTATLQLQKLIACAVNHTACVDLLSISFQATPRLSPGSPQVVWQKGRTFPAVEPIQPGGVRRHSELVQVFGEGLPLDKHLKTFGVSLVTALRWPS